MSSTLVELDQWKTDSPTDLHWRSDTKFTDIVAFRHKLLKFLEGDWGLWHIIGGTCFWMTLVHSPKSNKVYTCFWQTSQNFMVLLHNGNCLLPQNDNNKMATDIISMWLNKWFFPPEKEVCEGYVFTGVSLCLGGPHPWGVSVQESLFRGVSVQGGLCPGVSVQAGLCPGGISVQGGLCQEDLCTGGISVQGGLCQEGLCTGGSLSRGLCLGGSLSRGHLCSGGSMSRGSLYRGVSVQGVSVQGALCPGRSLSRRNLCPGGSPLIPRNKL